MCVVPLLQEGGATLRVLSREAREAENGIEFVTGDLATGEGVEAAVDGVETILHLAGSTKGDGEKALNLVRAASAAGARHLVYISVVGADRVPVAGGVDRAMFGYFEAKLARRAGRPRARHRRTAHVPDGRCGPGVPAAGRKHRALVPLRLPGKGARAFRAGANLAPDRAVGHRTWEDFLAAEVG